MPMALRDNAGELERENAELRRRLAEQEAELADALGRETATAEVLGVINSSPGDLGPVFDAMLEKAMRLCGAAFGTLQTFDGERWYGAAASTGVPLAFTEFRKNNPLPMVREQFRLASSKVNLSSIAST